MRVQSDTLFLRVPKWLRIVYVGTFLDVTHFLRGVNGSNLFVKRPNTSVDTVEGLEEARSDKSRYKSLPGRPET